MSKARRAEERGAGFSLRTHIMFMVWIGVVLPLALAGAWATQSATRSGRALLQQQLAASVDAVVDAIEMRWGYRRGELLLAADNVVARRLVAGVPLATADSQFLVQLYRQVALTIPSISYRDMAGRERWSTSMLPSPSSSDGAANVFSAQPPSPSITVSYPTHDSTGAVIGMMVARVNIESLAAPASTQLSVPGARMVIRDRSEGAKATQASADDTFVAGATHRIADAEWYSVARTMSEPALDVAVSAPTAPYVDPFVRVGRIGFIAVMVVTGTALLLSAFLTRRFTAPLDRMAAASAHVASGALDRRVDVSGPSEIRVLAVSFNSMTESLQHTLGELSRRSALAAVGGFATFMAHEVRNALTSLRIDLQRAEETLHASTAGRTLVSRSLETIVRLDATVTSALRVARTGTMTPTAVDLGMVIVSACQTVAPAFAQGEARLRCPDVGALAVDVLGNASALEVLFVNLLRNAHQALVGQGEVEIAINAEAEIVTISVRDSGVGIAEADLPRVFEPFFTTRADGTGLGLSIARQIAIAHGGDLRLQSSVQSGTTVRVVLRRAVPTPASLTLPIGAA